MQEPNEFTHYLTGPPGTEREAIHGYSDNFTVYPFPRTNRAHAGAKKTRYSSPHIVNEDDRVAWAFGFYDYEWVLEQIESLIDTVGFNDDIARCDQLRDILTVRYQKHVGLWGPIIYGRRVELGGEFNPERYIRTWCHCLALARQIKPTYSPVGAAVDYMDKFTKYRDGPQGSWWRCNLPKRIIHWCVLEPIANGAFMYYVPGTVNAYLGMDRGQLYSELKARMKEKFRWRTWNTGDEYDGVAQAVADATIKDWPEVDG